MATRRKRSVSTIAKSIVAGLGAAVTAAIPYSSDGINLQEALIILGAFLATQQATYWTPNADPTGTHQDESVQPPAGGAADVGLQRAANVVPGKRKKVWGWGG